MSYTLDLPVSGLITEQGYASFARELRLAYGSAPDAEPFAETPSGIILPTSYDGDLGALAERARERASKGHVLDVPKKDAEPGSLTAGGIVTVEGDLDEYLGRLVESSGVSTDLGDYGGLYPVLAGHWTREGQGEYVRGRQDAARAAMVQAAAERLGRPRAERYEDIWADAPTYTGWRGEDLNGAVKGGSSSPAPGTTTPGGIYMPSGGGSDVESCLAKELEAQGITVDPADYARLDPMAAGMLAAAGHEDIVEERAAQAKLEAYRDGFARAERRRREEREADADSRELDLSQSYILDARGRMASLRVGFSSGTWSASVSVRGGAMSVAVDGLADGEAEAVARRVHGLYEGALGQC